MNEIKISKRVVILGLVLLGVAAAAGLGRSANHGLASGQGNRQDHTHACWGYPGGSARGGWTGSGHRRRPPVLQRGL